MHRTMIDTKSEAFQFILGAVLGDGDILKRQIRFRTRDKEFAEKFSENCSSLSLKHSLIKYTVRNKPYYIIRISSVLASAEFKNEIIELKITPTLFSSLMDADGTCFYNSRWHGICLYNTNKKMLKKVSNFLTKNLINHNLHKIKQKKYAKFFGKKAKRKKAFFILSTNQNKKNIVLLEKILKFTIKRKKANFKKIIKYYLKQSCSPF